MHGDVQVRFGGRAEETDRAKPRHRTPDTRGLSPAALSSTHSPGKSSAGRSTALRPLRSSRQLSGWRPVPATPKAGWLYIAIAAFSSPPGAFSRNLHDAGLAPSMGAVGAPGDNAMVESFWGRMQVELLNRKKWKTRIELATAIHDWSGTCLKVSCWL